MKRISHTEDLADKTIRIAIHADGCLVLVFDDNDWCAISASDDSVTLDDRYSFRDIKFYLDERRTPKRRPRKCASRQIV